MVGADLSRLRAGGGRKPPGRQDRICARDGLVERDHQGAATLGQLNRHRCVEYLRMSVGSRDSEGDRSRDKSANAAQRPGDEADGNLVSIVPAMPGDVELDRLSSQELHDLAVHRAMRHLDARFFYQLMQLLPVAEAGAGEFEKSGSKIMRLRDHVGATDSGRGEVTDLMRPYYLEYLRKHRVAANAY